MAEITKGKYSTALPSIGVLSTDGMLIRKLALALSESAAVSRATKGSDECFDILFVDKRARGASALSDSAADIPAVRTVVISDRGNTSASASALPYPFSFRELHELVAGGEGSVQRLIIETDGRSVLLDGERIRLTEREHRLISAIAEGGGEFVGREKLRALAFGEDADGGILNVYIHYLREKLEKSGEKIILSSRLGGYRIDEKYLGVKN